VPAGSQFPGSAKAAKEYLTTVPSQVDSSQFTGLRDGFARQAAGFFKDLQKIGIKPTVTAGYESSGHSAGSDHYAGQAIDFVTPGGAGDAGKVQALADKYGIDLLDEYTNPSAYSTGGQRLAGRQRTKAVRPGPGRLRQAQRRLWPDERKCEGKRQRPGPWDPKPPKTPKTAAPSEPAPKSEPKAA